MFSFFQSKEQRLVPPQSAEELRQNLIALVAKNLKLGVSDLNVTSPFNELGFDSLTAVRFTGQLEEWLNIELEPTLLYNHNNVEALWGYLAEELGLSK